jgi:endonuclease YncB( thermonuclease family)
LGILFLLVLIISGAYFYNSNIQPPLETVTAAGAKIIAADGDSFAIGTRKLRLRGIDAPELKQICQAADGSDWPCGRTAKAALETLLTQPGLICTAELRDRFARSLAHCRTAQNADIGASQVSAGMAITDNFHDLRSYGSEEDAARNAKLGIWQGKFIEPKEWRDTHH